MRRKKDAKPLPQGDLPQPEMVLGVVYARAVEEAGGLPVVLPPLEDAAVAPLVEQLAGVCLSGGPDLDPAAYGADRTRAWGPSSRSSTPSSSPSSAGRTSAGYPCSASAAAARSSTWRAAARCTSTCPTSSDGSVAHRQTASGRETTHDIRIEAGSRLAEIVGPEDLDVNAFHHQAVDRLGRGLRAVAWAPDGIVEGIEGDGEALYLGVQWHVETLVHLPRHARLFEALVEAASRRRERRAA